MIITDKDWSDAYSIALYKYVKELEPENIYNKKEAIARFIAILKIVNHKLEIKDSKFIGEYSSFGNRALELGASIDEIEEVYSSVPTPEDWIKKFEKEQKEIKTRYIIPNAFWIKLKNAGIPISVKALPNKKWKDYTWGVLKIYFYKDTFDECSITIGISHLDIHSKGYHIFDSENLNNMHDQYRLTVSDYEWLEEVVVEALRDTIMGDNL